MYNIFPVLKQHFVSDLRQFSPVSFNIKTDCHNIPEILLKVVLNTINPKPILKLFILVHKW